MRPVAGCFFRLRSATRLSSRPTDTYPSTPPAFPGSSSPARCSTPRRPAPYPAERRTALPPRRATPTARPGRSHSPSHPRRHHQLVLTVHRRLCVVALLEALVARLHDPAFRVREVALRLLVRLPIRPLVRPPSLRVPGLPRPPAPRVICRPLRRLQPRLRRSGPDRQPDR